MSKLKQYRQMLTDGGSIATVCTMMKLRGLITGDQARYLLSPVIVPTRTQHEVPSSWVVDAIPLDRFDQVVDEIETDAIPSLSNSEVAIYLYVASLAHPLAYEWGLCHEFAMMQTIKKHRGADMVPHISENIKELYYNKLRYSMRG